MYFGIGIGLAIGGVMVLVLPHNATEIWKIGMGLLGIGSVLTYSMWKTGC